MKNFSITELGKNELITLNKEQFLQCIYHFSPSKTFTDICESINWDWVFKDFEFQIYIGNISIDEPLILDEKSNLLVVGNIKTPWLSNNTEGGAVITIGNVECDYYNNSWNKVNLISGNLIANKLLITAFQDSSIFVLGNVKTDFFYGEDIWISVGGNAEMEYGVGYCLALDYKESKKSFMPKHEKEKSLKYLNLDVDSEDFEVHNAIEIVLQNFPSYKPVTYKVVLR